MADLSEILETMKQQFSSLGPLIDNVKTKLLGLTAGTPEHEKETRALAELEGQANRLGSAISVLSGGFAKFTGVTRETEIAVAQLHPGFKQLGETITTNVITGVKNVAELVGVSLSTAMRALYNPLDESTQALGMLGVISDTAVKALQGLDEASKNLIRVQDSIRTAFVTGGRSIEQAEAAAKTYAQGLRDASAATGFGAKQIDEFNKTVGRHLPDSAMTAVTGIKEISDVMGKSVMPTTVAMTAFRAFGITGAEAARKTEEAILKFNQAPVETARQLGIMQRAAQGLGVNLGVAERQILQASAHLAIFGQKTGAASSLWRTFMDGLKDTVPIEEIGNMVNQLSQRLAQMSLQHRAFVSMMSGMGRGATALGGALRMELAMRGPEGMQRHLQGLTQTLERFAGGRIITLEQAARNPQLEQQFILQRQMLGQLTGITTQEQQNRILETLQKVQTGGMSQVEASGTLQEVLKGGKSLQERQLTVLEKILQHLRASFGGRLDVKLDEATNTIRDGLVPLQDVLAEGAGDPTRNILNNPAFGAAMRHVFTGVGRAARQVAGTATPFGREGVTGVEPLRMRAFESGLLALRAAGAGFLTAPGRGREAVRPPTRAAARVRMPEARRPAAVIGAVRAPQALRIPGFRSLTTHVAQGNQIIHRDLQQLIRTTREGSAAVKETKAAAEAPAGGAAAGEKTITVRIVGDESAVFEKLADKIKEWKNDMELTQQRQTLGIYD